LAASGNRFGGRCEELVYQEFNFGFERVERIFQFADLNFDILLFVDSLAISDDARKDLKDSAFYCLVANCLVLAAADLCRRANQVRMSAL